MTSSAPPRIFAPQRRALAHARAAMRQQSGAAARFVADDMMDDLAERMDFMRLAPDHGLLIAPWPMAHALPGTFTLATPLTLDEALPLPGAPYDFIASCGSLATVNDLPGALLHIRHALAPGGIAMVSMVGAGSCTHLRRAMLEAEPDRPSARMHPLVDNRAATALLERAGFGRFVVDTHHLDVAYRSLDRLVADLRDQALGNQLAEIAPPLSRAARDRATAAFLAQADADGRVVERFDILTLTGWA